MVRQIGMGYGIWESLAHLAGTRLGGHEKVWVTGVYGLSQVWIKTEATVVSCPSVVESERPTGPSEIQNTPENKIELCH